MRNVQYLCDVCLRPMGLSDLVEISIPAWSDNSDSASYHSDQSMVKNTVKVVPVEICRECITAATNLKVTEGPHGLAYDFLECPDDAEFVRDGRVVLRGDVK